MPHYSNSLIPNQPFGTDYSTYNPNPVDGDACQPKRDKYMPQYLLTDTLHIQFRNYVCGGNIMCNWDWASYGANETQGTYTFDADWVNVGSYHIHVPTPGSTPLLVDIPAGSTTNKYKVTFTIFNYLAGTITPAVIASGVGYNGTAESYDGTYTQVIDVITNKTIETIVLTPSDDFDGAITDINIQPLEQVLDCAEQSNLVPNDDGSICHDSVYGGGVTVSGLLTIGSTYKFIIECESLTGTILLSNGVQTFSIISGINEIYLHAYSPDYSITFDASSDGCISDVRVYNIDSVTCSLIRENENQTETSFDIEAYKTLFQDFTTYIVPVEDLIEGGLTEGCFHFEYASDCDETNYLTNTFQIQNTLEDCFRLIEATGECEQFGFYFGGGFKLSHRAKALKYNPNYVIKNDIDSDASGEYRRQFAEREKKYLWEIGWADEQFYDCFSVQLLLDLVIDGIDYFYKETSLQPEYDKERLSDLAQVAVDLYVGIIIRKNNCTQCGENGQTECVSELSFTADNPDRITILGLMVDGVFVEFSIPVDYTDIATLETELNALGYGLWTISLVGPLITISFVQYDTTVTLQSIVYVDSLEPTEMLYIPFTSADCGQASVPAFIRNKYTAAGVPTDDWFQCGDTIYVKSCAVGIDLILEFQSDWLANDASSTVEWVGYTPAAVISTPANATIVTSMPDAYTALVVSDGVTYESNTINVNNTEIVCGLLGYCACDDVPDPCDSTNISECTGVVTSDSSIPFVVTDLGGGASFNISTTGIGDATGHAYTSSRVWKKIFDGDTCTAVDITVDTNVDNIDVTESGVYAYFADDILYGGMVAPFIKIV